MAISYKDHTNNLKVRTRERQANLLDVNLQLTVKRGKMGCSGHASRSAKDKERQHQGRTCLTLRRIKKRQTVRAGRQERKTGVEMGEK